MALPAHQNLLDKKKSLQTLIDKIKSGEIDVTPQGDTAEYAKEVALDRQETFLRQVNTEIAKHAKEHESKVKK